MNLEIPIDIRSRVEIDAEGCAWQVLTVSAGSLQPKATWIPLNARARDRELLDLLLAQDRGECVPEPIGDYGAHIRSLMDKDGIRARLKAYLADRLAHYDYPEDQPHAEPLCAP